MRTIEFFALAFFLSVHHPPEALAGSDFLLLEAEAFETPGGWVVDQQAMEVMGSPYLLAHGLGRPVADAVTHAVFPAAGRYRCFVRTRNWVAPWNASEAPGRFRLLVGGKPLETIFGTEGAEWHWQKGGTVEVVDPKVEIVLRDLTGFEGRCDAILFTTRSDFIPPDKEPALSAFRRKLLGLPAEPRDAGKFDLVVVGGGIAGICASVSAARLGLKTALVQDRPVLGGNNSSEVRVWLGGKTNFEPYPRVGDLVRELDSAPRTCPGPAAAYRDEKKLRAVRGEKNLSLFLEFHVNEVRTEDGSITAVAAQNIRSGRKVEFRGRWFVDATGDGTVGYLAGADFAVTRKGHMGPTNLWRVTDTGKSSPFPRCPWAIDLRGKPFPKELDRLGKWFWESGFDYDPIREIEFTRDTNFRAMYGAWDYLKNVLGKYPTYRIEWAAYVAGKRESRRLLGDIVLTKEDLISSRKYPDGCVPTSWSIDLHLPHPAYVKGFEKNPFISQAHFTPYKRPYWVPYRCLYSRNVKNLFMAGRDISVTHEALGAVRVQRTTGMMGEIVGMAAALCKKYRVNPREVYAEHLPELRRLMKRGVGKRPKAAR